MDDDSGDDGLLVVDGDSDSDGETENLSTANTDSLVLLVCFRKECADRNLPIVVKEAGCG